MWFISRIAAWKLMTIENAKNFGVLSNVLLILILIFLTIYFKYRTNLQERPSFLEDLKDSMKSAMKYVLGVSAGITLFYGAISNDVATIRQARITAFNEGIQSEENFNKLKSENLELKDMTREQIIQKNTENVERFVSIHMQVLGGLLALTFVSLVYSMMAVMFWRAFVKKL
jgi:hypothetical protein